MFREYGLVDLKAGCFLKFGVGFDPRKTLCWCAGSFWQDRWLRVPIMYLVLQSDLLMSLFEVTWACKRSLRHSKEVTLKNLV